MGVKRFGDWDKAKAKLAANPGARLALAIRQATIKNALLLVREIKRPGLFRLDFGVAQDLFKNLGGARHSLQFRADFLNFSNLVNHDWGVGQRLVNRQPLLSQGRTMIATYGPQIEERARSINLKQLPSIIGKV